MEEVNTCYPIFALYLANIPQSIMWKSMKKRIVILASGNGTNAENIIRHFQKTSFAEVVLVLSNNKNAKVLEKAENLNVKTEYFSKDQLISEEGILKTLQEINADLIVLAGFLLKFPHSIIKEFSNKVVNIHPALLPKYGGKGMYGRFVHEEVLKNNETETGITIHYVNENYDEGAIIFQKSVSLSPEDTPTTVAEKIHILEQEWFPKVIEEILHNE